MELKIKATFEEALKVQKKWAIGILQSDEPDYVRIKIYTEDPASIFEIGMLFGIYGMETAVKKDLKNKMG